MKHFVSKEDLEFRIRLVKRIKAMRLRQNLTQFDAAIACDINPNYYSRIERGKTGEMNMRTIYKIAIGLQSKIYEFLD